MASVEPETVPPMLVPSLLFIALVVAVVGSLGAPLITSVATTFRVSLAAAQWTLTVALLAGALATPVLGRLGSGQHRRATVLATLVIVLAGSVLTVLPLAFAWLLIGRAAQGVGLGLTALMMGTARDTLGQERAGPTIALISVASTIGIGIGYPLAGFLTDVAGLRAAYGLGVAVTLVALGAAALNVPPSPPGRKASVDVIGAVLLGACLLALLLVVSETALWENHMAVAFGLVCVGSGLLVAWVRCERSVTAPLVDIKLLRKSAVAGANLSMLTGGMGMYLLLTLITRYVQTPIYAGYGFGASTFVAGLVLVPFSVMGFIAGRLFPRLHGRLQPSALLATSAGIVLGGFVIFAVARGRLLEPLVSMAVLGFGVGSFSSAMPGVILEVTPKAETSSAMGFNQVVRSVGFSVGSAIGGLILAANTESGHRFPVNSGYTMASWIGMGLLAFTVVISVRLSRIGH